LLLDFLEQNFVHLETSLARLVAVAGRRKWLPINGGYRASVCPRPGDRDYEVAVPPADNTPL